jgi:hypothetical protein
LNIINAVAFGTINAVYVKFALCDAFLGEVLSFLAKYLELLLGKFKRFPATLRVGSKDIEAIFQWMRFLELAHVTFVTGFGRWSCRISAIARCAF